MRNDLEADYVLVDDIDASDTGNWNDGKGWKVIGENFDNSFKGTLDGQGYEISNLYIERGGWYIGLFGVSSGEAEFKNVGLVNVDVNGDSRVGALAGYAMSGVVTDSYVTGKVTGESNVGGLIGKGGVDVTDSYADVEVTGEASVGGLIGSNGGKINSCYATGNVIGEGGWPHNIGGLVGSNGGTHAEVSYSYATGDVTGRTGSNKGANAVGGLVGSNDGIGALVNNSYATGAVTGEEDVGGLVGWSNQEVSDSFCDKETTNQDDAIGTEEEGGTSTNVESLPSEEMQDISTFEDAGWDIEITSEADPTGGYPFLSWQVGGSPTWSLFGFELTIHVEGKGTTDPDAGIHSYMDGEEITVEAVPDEGWEFKEWTGDETGTEETIHITMTGDKEITANFEESTQDGMPGFEIISLLSAAGVMVLFFTKKRKRR